MELELPRKRLERGEFIPKLFDGNVRLVAGVGFALVSATLLALAATSNSAADITSHVSPQPIGTRIGPDYTDGLASRRLPLLLIGAGFAAWAALLFVQHFRAVAQQLRSQILQEAELRNRFFTDNPDPILTVSRSRGRLGEVLKSSASADELIGAQLPGRYLDEFVDRRTLGRLLLSVSEGPGPDDLELRQAITVHRDDGEQSLIDVSLQPVVLDGEPAVAVSVRDATVRLDALGSHLASTQRAQAERVLFATHHQLSREIVLVGFEIDDLAEEGVDVSSLLAAYDRLAEECDGVAALARLGIEEQTKVRQRTTARRLLPPWNGGEIFDESVGDLVGVDPALLRLACREIVLLAAKLGTDQVRVATDTQRLEFRWKAKTAIEQWDSSDVAVENDPLPITRRVLRVHGATGRLRCDEAHAVSFVCRFKLAASEAQEVVDLTSQKNPALSRKVSELLAASLRRTEP